MTSRYPVNYPYIRSIGYDIDDNILEVEFKEGTIYHYFDVPEEIYWKFREIDEEYELDTVPVQSSRIREIGYDDDMQIALVELITGEVFLFLGIDEDTYVAFANASSPGSFLNTTLKYAGYRYRKIGRTVKEDSINPFLETHPRASAKNAFTEPPTAKESPPEKTATVPGMKKHSIAYLHVKSVGYDQQNETMEVEFLDGAIYQYYHVPKEYYERLMATDSDGSDIFRERVESREIRSIGYDSVLKILHVGFHDKSVCLYFGIQEGIYKNLMVTASRSLYLKQTVKWSGFRYHQVRIESRIANTKNDNMDVLTDAEPDEFEPIENDDYYYEVGCHGAACEADSHFKRGISFLSGVDCKQDFNKARIHFKIAADHEHRGALFALGEMFMNGTGVAQSFRQAAKWYFLGCGSSSLCVNYDAGIYELWAKVIHKLAYMFKDGIGVPQNNREAMKWFLLSAELKNDDAQLQIGNQYFDGQSVSQDYVTARRWYLQAAGKGNVRAQCMLGSIYKHGAGVEKDYEKSLRWFQPAAESGDAVAQFNIGWMFIKGEGVEADGQKAFEWLSMAAEQGNTDAQKAMAAIGLMYFYGKDVIEDYYEAAKWLKKAVITYAPINTDFGDKTNLNEDRYIDPKNDYRGKAHKGDSEAQTNLGLLYINGHGHAVQEYRTAGTWYIEAIEKGLLDLESPMFLVIDGTGTVNKNAVEAFKWFELAAKRENSNAQYQLGKLYHTGDGVEQNHKEAFYWYKKAAEHGHAEAVLIVRQELQDADYQKGKLYYTGNGVEQNYEEAVLWYKKAADGGHAEAQNALGGAYVNGDGVEPDYSIALHWFKKAASQGHRRALFNLGILYWDGKGVEADIIKSMAYYTAAKRQGHVGAKEMMDEMRKIQILTNEQFEQVDLAASELLLNVSAKGST